MANNKVEAAVSTVCEAAADLGWLPDKDTISRLEYKDVKEHPFRFYRDFISQNRPAVITGVTRALGIDKVDWGTAIDAERKVSVNFTPNGKADAVLENKVFAKPCEEKIPYGEFWEYITSRREDRGVPYLSHQNDSLRQEIPELIGKYVPERIEWLDESLETKVDAVNLWIGDERSHSSTHSDFYENIYCCLKGRKVFNLLPPCFLPQVGEGRFPAATYHREDDGALELQPEAEDVVWVLKEAEDLPECLTVELEAGDAIYLPSLWLHSATQNCLTVGVNYWYDMDFDVKYCYYSMVRALMPSPALAVKSWPEEEVRTWFKTHFPEIELPEKFYALDGQGLMDLADDPEFSTEEKLRFMGLEDQSEIATVAGGIRTLLEDVFPGSLEVSVLLLPGPMVIDDSDNTVHRPSRDDLAQGMHSSGTSFYRAHSTSSRSFATGGTMSSSVLTNPWARAEQKRCSPEQIDLIMRQFSTLRCILGSIGRRGGREGKQMRSEIEAIYDAMYEAVASMEFGFFERFSEKQVRDIVKVLQIRRMREGDVVCHKGEEGHEFYLIFRGAVDIYPEPKEPPVASFVAGDSFGELALIHDAPRAAAVVCQTDCTFGVLHRVPFIRATSPQKVLVESRIVDFLSSCSPFCCIHTRKLWKSIDTWSQKRSLPGRCIYRSRSPWMPIESQGTEEAYDGDVDVASEFRWSEQSFEVGPGDAPVPFIRVTEPELTPLPFFVVMRGKVRVHGTIAIHGKLAATWKSDEGEGREGISFSSEDCVDSDAVGLGFVRVLVQWLSVATHHADVGQM
ncbi:hypothetical protein FOZ62_018737, partial [Perkinsus olseni]